MPRIPWQVLTRCAGIDLLVYGALSMKAHASAWDLAYECGWSMEHVFASLQSLCNIGFIRRCPSQVPCDGPEGYYIHFSVYSNPRITDRSLNTKDLDMSLRAGAREQTTQDCMFPVVAPLVHKKVRSRSDAVQVFVGEQARKEPFTAEGVLGCFYVLYKEHTGLDYKGSSFQEELREAELLLYTASDVAIWCVRALFSEHMAWVKNKSLTFLSNAANVHRFVLGVAMELRAKNTARPEWQGGAVGVVHRPNR